MVKSELVQILKDKVELSRAQAESVVDILIETISDALSRGDRVEIRGFGSFSVNSYKSYVGRNPKTGDQINVPPKKLPFFKVGKQLKKLVDE
jgi:integration host factor subunit beta